MTEPERGLIDTNIVVLLKHLDPSVLPDEPVISAVTLAELSVGPLVTDDLRERSVRQAHLQQAEADFDALPMDADVARAFGRVAADLRRRGRKTSARAFDALIAATAVAHGLPLYTCNPDDFDGVEGLDVRAILRPGA
ncbi:type II toxin-antitoxin system VapC family toxin [Microbacterium sp. No. 7]|uniref:type II toxin-antitoxin system VapC family toxin n=1 Tax=Microbacterium sp. No. 7 TaxID=1714373 RepID=UPI0006CF2F0F|nr:type II toxin-antitoxin system VapC family toxin [Microbacterium sp. No. 7]ALJ21602.1 twitching motility protein PilT [Microbacterium sp. No. 7]